MSIFGEFAVPPEAFVLTATLEAVPDLEIEIERLVAAGGVLTPTFWVDGDADAFEAAAGDDDSISELTRIDEFEAATLFRATWARNNETLVFAYTKLGAAILEATGNREGWNLRMRFEDHDRLREFQSYCRERDIGYRLQRLYEISHPRRGVQYGLTPKQHEALVTAWERGYWKSPRQTDLDAVADELGITQQSLSDRLRRAHYTLIENTLIVASDEGS
ncbi:MAG: bacterio-opsin activator domain-containing protein [Haloarculaceae archaeon]